MTEVIPIKGATAFTINLDPSVWIFDERKFDLDPFIQTGAREYVKEREVSGSYAISFEPFLQNAEPFPTAKYVRCHVQNGEQITVTLEEAKQGVLAFSKDGQPLKADGPVHLYYGNDKQQPITHITMFEVAE